MMNPCRRLFFTLLKIGLSENTIGLAAELPAAISEAEWDEVFALSVRQGVAAIVWDAIEGLQQVGALDGERQMSRRLKVQWALNVQEIERRWAKQKQTIGQLADLYDRHQMPMMVLKGYGLSLCYPHPDHRPCGDIDIWLFGRQAAADKMMSQMVGIEIDRGKHHHTTFVYNGILVENHYDFLNVHAHASNRQIERILKHAVTEPTTTEPVGSARIYLPPVNFSALFLLRHAAAHFAAAEIGMRHVADWAMFVGKYHADIDWATLHATARQMNMHRFLDCLNAIVIDCLGVAADKIPAFERDSELEKRVLNEILQPEFDEKRPDGHVLRVVRFKFIRWWRNRWKHRIVYKENLFLAFVQSVWSHLLKPHSIMAD